MGKDEALSMVLKNVVVPGGGHYQGFNPILDKLRQEEMMRLKEQVAVIANLPPHLTYHFTGPRRRRGEYGREET